MASKISQVHHGEVVHTAPAHGPPARVRVEGNPPYLKSEPDGTEANNLGGLPEY